MADADAAVTLRPWYREDAPALVAAWNDPEILAGSSPPADRTLAGARRWIEGCGLREDRLLAIDRVIDVGGEVVGEAGISEIDRRRGAALIGWWIAAEHRGRGHASAGVRSMVDLLFAPDHRAGLCHLVAQIDVDNRASIRVAERAGFALLRPGTDDAPHVFAAQR